MMRKIFKGFAYLILLILLSAAGYQGWSRWQQYSDEQAIQGSPQGQLPGIASPLQYWLHLDIDPKKAVFTGIEEIEIKLLKASDHFWLHGKNIEVFSSEIIDASGQHMEVDYHEKGHSGVVKISFPHVLKPQTIRLKLSYQADYDEKLAGLYKVETAGRPYVFTQFEATDARLAFPGFDEPRFKVPFSISLTVPELLVAVSNAPEKSRQPVEGGMVEIRFEKTPPLPTYLVAMAVGDFDLVEAKAIPANAWRKQSIPLRALAVKGEGDKLGFALSHTAEIVTALENYFDRAYPYKKLDLVAVPDFAAGAMENAGLITYREQILLLGENPTISQKRDYYVIHAHELAHQWFGNLVTMPWWNDIWLNESFATWMENKIVAELYPDLRIDQDSVKEGHRVMGSDSYVATRRIREPINNNGDIENAFDGITYSKGGAVLAMFERFLGAEGFRQGVRYHLKKFEFGTANADDFIQSLGEASSQSLGVAADKKKLVGAFRSFLDQSGVPLIKTDWQCQTTDIKEPVSGDQVSVRVTLNQSRYLPLGSRGEDNRLWQLPVCLTAYGEGFTKQHCLLMTEPSQSLFLELDHCPGTILPNTDGSGYYRWSLSEKKWLKLLSNLEKFNNVSLISVSSNLLAEVKAGRVSPSLFIAAAANFVALEGRENKVLPLAGLEFIAQYLAFGVEKKLMLAYLRELYKPLLDDLGLEADTERDISEPVVTANLRYRLVDLFAMNLKEPLLRETLKTRGEAYIGFNDVVYKINEDVINGDLASIAMGVAVQEIGNPYFDALKQLLDESSDGTIRERLLEAMAFADDPKLSERALGLVASLDTRLNEKGIIIFGQLAQPQTRELVYQWFKDKYSIMSMILPDNYLAYIPKIGSGFCDNEIKKDLQAFFEPKMDEIIGGARNLAETLERIETCAALAETVDRLDIPVELSQE